MIKRSLTIIVAAALVACNNESNEAKTTESIVAQNISIDSLETKSLFKKGSFKETEEDFIRFTTHFKDLAFANDTTAIKAFNLTDYKVNELMLDFFTDTNGLVERKADFTPNDMGYSYSSSYASTIDGDEFESGIYYYFKYNQEKASYDLVNVLAAG